MTLEFIIFIGAVLFGILLYWRESNGNGAYRALNKIVNSVTAFFIVVSLLVQFLTPFEIFGSYNGISTFASSIVGTLIGTYVASFVIKSGDVIEDKTGDFESIVSDVVEKGKDIVEDVKDKASEVVDDIKSRTTDVADTVSETIEDVKDDASEVAEETGKSARERLKDKGLL